MDNRQLILDMAANFGKASLPTAQINSLLERLEPYSTPVIKKAFDRLMEDSTRKQFFPVWAEILRYLPEQSKGRQEGGIGWWASSGEWGGNWSKSSREVLLIVAVEMLANADPTNELGFHAARRESFLRFCATKGIDRDLIELCHARHPRGGVTHETAAEALNAEVSQAA